MGGALSPPPGACVGPRWPSRPRVPCPSLFSVSELPFSFLCVFTLPSQSSTAVKLIFRNPFLLNVHLYRAPLSLHECTAFSHLFEGLPLFPEVFSPLYSQALRQAGCESLSAVSEAFPDAGGCSCLSWGDQGPRHASLIIGPCTAPSLQGLAQVALC